MATPITQTTFSADYFDDFADSDNYHRVLFNPARAVQARELTQLQTMIQAELARFGNWAFKPGSAVNTGSPTVNTNLDYIKLTSGTLNDDYIGAIYTCDNSGLQFEILSYANADGGDPATLFVQYLGDGTTTALTAVANEDLTAPGGSGLSNLTVASGSTAVGKSIEVSNGEGSFFVKGHFVYTAPQSLIVSKYTNQWTGNVGFKVTEDIVTTADTTALYDNSNGTPNNSAPGADRYRITLTLIAEEDVAADETFIFYASVRQNPLDDVSEVVDITAGNPILNILGDTLATRTFEESGDYVVRPFKLKFNEDSASTHLLADVSSGTAYVKGYRINYNTAQKLRIAKPTTEAAAVEQAIGINYGNYVRATAFNGAFDISTFEQYNLASGTGGGGSIIGTARVRAVERDGSFVRIYLFQISMNAGQSFQAVKSITDGTLVADLELSTAGNAILYGANNNDLLFPLAGTRPSSVAGSANVTLLKTITKSSSGTTIDLTSGDLAGGQAFVDGSRWIVINNATNLDITSSVTVTINSNTSATITNAGSGVSHTVYLYVLKTDAGDRSKTLTTPAGSAIALDSDGNGTLFIPLGETDVYEIVELRDSDASGADITNNFRLDGGQRDNYYAEGRALLKRGLTDPTTSGNVWAQFRYFAHGAGEYFTVSSYSSSTGITTNDGTFSYGDIPSYTLNNGTVIQLRDVIDFRSSETPGTGDFAVADVNSLPPTGDALTTDVTYYEGRRDKLIASKDGTIKFVFGEPDIDPVFPPTPVDALTLYKVSLNPNTISTSDVTIEPIDNKRFTMRDIGALEKRIDKLEEQTALNLLEISTQSLSVVDSADRNRTKSGFLADNFSDQFFSDTTNVDYRAAVDPQAGVVRPSVSQNNVRLLYDSAQSSNVILKGDNVYLNYTVDSDWIVQSVVSGTENVNPFAVTVGEGAIELSPASDEWREIRQRGERVIDNGVRLDTSGALLFNEWQWNWQGAAAESDDLTGAAVAEGSITTTRQTFFGLFRRRRTRNVTDRVVSDETIREFVGNRVVDVGIVPFMRSRKVSFRAVGLKRNQQYFAFFDDVDVSSWIREENFTRFAENADEYGNIYANATEHPDTSGTLTSDANGVIEGTFFIPNTSAIRFRTGARTFKLLNTSSGIDENATSIARGQYTASGVLETRADFFESTRVITVRGDTSRRRKRFDPLAQSFAVPEQDGAFVTHASVYFQTKPTAGENQAPVALEIRPMVNGIPSANEVIPGSTVVLTPAQVNALVTDSLGTETQANVIANPTVFTFPEPIHLQGNTEYAIVVMSDSTAYNCYVAETEAFILGSNQAKRVAKQPSMGSLFKSQNGATWSPDQTKDLSFKLSKAQFSTSASSLIVENASVPKLLLEEDPIFVESGSGTVRVQHPNSGLREGDTVVIAGVTTFGGITDSNINGTRTITAADYTGYTFTAGNSDTATDTVFGGGSAVTATQYIDYDVANIAIDTMVLDGTQLSAEGKFTTGRSWAGSEAGFAKDPTYVPVGLQTNLFSTRTLAIYDSDQETSAPLNSKSVTIKLNMSTTNANLSPVVDLQRCSLITVSNVIDDQDSAGVVGNAPILYVDETSPIDGSAAAKHITTPVEVESASVGLKILLAANRPDGSHIDLYYRTAIEGTNITDVSWTLLDPETNIGPDDNPDIFREYRYLAGGLDGTLTPFTQYQIKLVFRSNNSARVPMVTDLRVIALAD